jgi:hypothetical protein
VHGDALLGGAFQIRKAKSNLIYDCH